MEDNLNVLAPASPELGPAQPQPQSITPTAPWKGSHILLKSVPNPLCANYNHIQKNIITLLFILVDINHFCILYKYVSGQSSKTYYLTNNVLFSYSFDQLLKVLNVSQNQRAVVDT